jgi:hypothetical protein
VETRSTPLWFTKLSLPSLRFPSTAKTDVQLDPNIAIGTLARIQPDPENLGVVK